MNSINVSRIFREKQLMKHSVYNFLISNLFESYFLLPRSIKQTA